MGMFDKVYFDCLVCGNALIEYSKAGNCTLERYHQEQVPACIAKDIIDNKITCEECKSIFSI